MQKQAKLKHISDIAYRRERVLRLMVSDSPTRDMAAQLGVSEPTIRRDLRAIRNRWGRVRRTGRVPVTGRRLATILRPGE